MRCAPTLKMRTCSSLSTVYFLLYVARARDARMLIVLWSTRCLCVRGTVLVLLLFIVGTEPCSSSNYKQETASSLAWMQLHTFRVGTRQLPAGVVFASLDHSWTVLRTCQWCLSAGCIYEVGVVAVRAVRWIPLSVLSRILPQIPPENVPSCDVCSSP